MRLSNAVPGNGIYYMVFITGSLEVKPKGGVGPAGRRGLPMGSPAMFTGGLFYVTICFL